MGKADGLTGELEPAFIKLYTDSLGKIKDLSKSDRNVLDRLFVAVNYVGEIRLGQRLREEICEYAEITDGSLGNVLSKLVKKEIILRDAPGIYVINPELAFKGKLSQRTALVIRLTGKDAGRPQLMEVQ